MAYRQSLMKYAENYGVSRASRKYNKSRSYIYFWKARWDGSVASLACQSRRPHSHPNQHTEAELKLIRDMRRRNPHLGMVELWRRLRQRGYTRRPESLFRVMRKLGLFSSKEKKPAYKPRACLKIGDVSSREGFWAAGKQFFRRNPGGLQGKIAPSRGQKTRRLGMLAFFKQALSPTSR